MECIERFCATSSTSSVVSSIATRVPWLGASVLGTAALRILDSGTSFHKIHNSTSVCSLGPSSASLFVNTFDGTFHPILSHGTLHTSRFMVPSISHVYYLNLQLLYVG